MVNIDTVYQKTLTIANKEQRGYITPQEFNLLADKAQLDVVNNLFHAEKMAYIKPTKNQTESSDEREMISEKLSFIRAKANLVVSGNSAGKFISLPSDLYRIASIYNTTYGYMYCEVDKSELYSMNQNPLTSPTIKRPVYSYESAVEINNSSGHELKVRLYPESIAAGSASSNITIEYYKKPKKPNWSYIVVNQKALYNYSNSTHFDLHPSQEEDLVMRILQLAGITIGKPEISQAAFQDKQATRQEQNS